MSRAGRDAEICSEAVRVNRDHAIRLLNGGTPDMVAKAHVYATLALADAVVLHAVLAAEKP